MSDCLFCRIAAEEIPANILYRDEDMLAFHDIAPAAPVHFLLIPRLHIESMAALTSEHQTLVGKMLVQAAQLAQQQGLAQGFRTIINTGRMGGQEIFHLHIHILGDPAQQLPSMMPKNTNTDQATE